MPGAQARRTRIAVAGAGLIGRAHIAALRASPSCELAAIVDPSPGAGADFSSIEELLKKARPDGMVLATPNPLHVPQALQCLEAGVPVLVDGAAMLPPTTSLTKFIADGADLVTFSGGKGLMGPQSSGILAGRADLIRAARVNGSPYHSVGRSAKAAKEDIVGLIVALQNYMERDHEADMAFWKAQAEYMLERLQGFKGVQASYLYDGREHPVPRVELLFLPESGIDSHQFVLEMEEHNPRIFLFEPTGPSAKPNAIAINTQTMQPGDEEIVAREIANVLSQKVSRAVPVAALTRGSTHREG